MWRVATGVVLLASAAHAEPQVTSGMRGFVVEDGGFGELAACTVDDIGWSFYACLSLVLGFQDDGAIVTDAGELGARFRPGEHVSFTFGAGSSLVSAVIRYGSCVIDSPSSHAEDCDWIAMPLHAYPTLGAHLHVSTVVVSAHARYHLSERDPDGFVRAPYGVALGLGVSWEW